MMRCLSLDQKNLYQQYSILGEGIAKVSTLEKKFINESIWQAISKEGIWSLPIARQYGGCGLSWQDCLVALDGFFSNYSNIEFLTLLISQISSLYLISQYGTELIKKIYLPRLIHGEMACLLISKHIHTFLAYDAYLSIRENQIASIRNNKILIHAEKINDDIVFYIKENQIEKISAITNKPIRSILLEENKFIAKEIGLSALCDLINFERIFYGTLAAKSAWMIVEKDRRLSVNT
jgi:hypothetical protein